jgi:hypothetical protein
MVLFSQQPAFQKKSAVVLFSLHPAFQKIGDNALLTPTGFSENRR